MIRIMVMNGLLISLILIWTSAAKEPSAGYLIKSSTKPPTGPLNYSVSKPMVSLHETNKEILRRKFLCGSELGGVCVNKKKSCPSNLPSEKSPGKPYCSKKKDRCCYPDPTTAAPPTVVPTTTTTSEDVNWSDIRNACIKSNNYKTYQPLALDICKEKCVEEDAINCQSIEYSSAQQMCAISEARSDSDDFIEPCFVDGWVFAEIELNAGPTTGPPTTTAPGNTTTNGPTTDAPTTTAPGNTTTNVTSCNLVWKYEEDRPLIMIWGGQTVVPPITDIDISNDPNRFPEKNYLIFACPGENNIFKHVDGNHTKLHGECISHDQFQVCVNNYSEIMDLSNLSCRSKMHPSIIKQVNDTSYKKSCEDIGGELYKIGYIYGDKKEFKDLDTKVCFSEKDQTTLWTSTNIDKIEISSSTRYEDPTNFRTARGFAMKAFYSQKSQHELLKEVLDKEATSVWNEKACRNHGGHCVRGGKPCPKHLPHQTSQGEPFCSSFYRCCYSEQCDPTTCTYKGKKGKCSLDSLPGTTGVGNQECKKGCQCYIKDNETLRQFESLQERMDPPKPLEKKKCDAGTPCIWDWVVGTPKFPPLIFHSKDKIVLPSIEPNEKKPTVRISNGEDLIFTCSNKKFENYGTPTIKAKCVDGKLLDERNSDTSYEWGKMGCKEQTMSKIIQKFKTSSDGNKVHEKCLDDAGLMWQIGFPADPTESRFYEMVGVCFSNTAKTTLFTIHQLHGKSLSAKEPERDPGKDFPTNEKQFFNDFKMKHIYNSRTEWSFFKKMKYPGTIVDPMPQYRKYFSKGHLAPRGDFIVKAMQDATYTYINALPQWSIFNGANWGAIEEEIRIHAGLTGDTYTIGTSGFDSPLKLDKKYIYIGDYDQTGNKIPVPGIMWKAVLETDIIFISNNDPTLPPSAPECTPICDLVGWLTKTTKANLKKPTLGLIQCCSIEELIDTKSRFKDVLEELKRYSFK